MKNCVIHLSDIVALSKIITHLPCKIVVFDSNNILPDLSTAPNITILKDNNTAFFYRTEKYPFLLYVNLTNTPVTDTGFDVLIDVFGTIKNNDIPALQFETITNPKGYINFLYVKNSNHPPITVFGNAYGNHTRQSFWLFYNKKMLIDTLIPNHGYTINLNPANEQAHLLAAYNTQPLDSDVAFLKIPTTENAQKSALNELLAISTHPSFLSHQFVVPKVKMVYSSKSIINYTYPVINPNQQPTSITTSAIATMLECYTNGTFFQLKELHELPLHSSIKKRLERIERHIATAGSQESMALLNKLFFLQTEMSKLSKEVYVTFSHGSFLPKDFFILNNNIYIYNWENFNKSASFLYDFFNIPMQLEAINPNPNYTNAQKNIEAWLATPNMIETIKKYSLSIKLYYKLYVLQAASAFLEKNTHVATSKTELQFWLEALNDVVKTNETRRILKEKNLTAFIN